MGMILGFATAVLSDSPCPHTHGDDPVYVPDELKKLNLSPHAWG